MKSFPTIEPSRMHRYAVGIVVEDNPDNISKIKIFPIEYIGNPSEDLIKPKELQGMIKTKTLKPSNSHDNVEYLTTDENIVIESTSFLLATWINKNNRITPPNVCRGERVIIYRYSNNDEFYWETELTDLKLRKKEHIVYTFSAKPKLDDKEDPLKDRYTVTFSSKENRLSIHTTNKYGEYTTYDINLFTKKGYLEILDGKTNSIKLDSVKSAFTIHLKGDKTTYDLVASGNDGEFVLKDKQGNTIHLDSVNSALTTNINEKVNVKTKVFTVDCETFNVKSKNFNIETTGYSLKSSNNTIQSSTTEYKGGLITHDNIPIDKTHTAYGNLGFPTSTPIG